VSVQFDHPFVVREPKSDLDRHAIHAASRLLATGIRLECQLRSTAKLRAELGDRPTWSEPTARLFQMCYPKINCPRNEES
jgi:hypothetical protein